MGKPYIASIRVPKGHKGTARILFVVLFHTSIPTPSLPKKKKTKAAADEGEEDKIIALAEKENMEKETAVIAAEGKMVD
ncbi:hypothetical protein PG990_004268 [Apiospora arundinis]